MFVGIRPTADNIFLQGKCKSSICCQNAPSSTVRSLDGQVKLFDIRASEVPIQTWNPLPSGSTVAAFDVHALTPVFGM